MAPPWTVTPDKVQAAIERIVETSRPKKLILFGSFVRKETTRNSDLDILVITSDDIKNPRQESIRIRRALRGISMPMDILVITESKFQEMSDQPGLIYREALQDGEVVYQAA
jgi:predicted nucleotidyltransferase